MYNVGLMILAREITKATTDVEKALGIMVGKNDMRLIAVYHWLKADPRNIEKAKVEKFFQKFKVKYEQLKVWK